MNRLYFAYGSNLCLPRIRHRIPGVGKVARARLDGHALRWHKRGSDGSGKCSIEKVGGESVVHGALFEVPTEERPVLDRIEGLGVGYRETEVQVVPSASPGGAGSGNGTPLDADRVPAWTYVATDSHVVDDLRPFRWYKALVLAGAAAMAFPSAYLDGIRAVRALEDPDTRRASRNRRFLDPRFPGPLGSLTDWKADHGQG